VRQIAASVGAVRSPGDWVAAAIHCTQLGHHTSYG
jgi:hypothetical protein